MKVFFKDLFDYNHAMNQKVIRSMLQNSYKLNDKSIQLMSHLLNAHHIWNHRVLKLAPTVAVWQINDINILESLNETNYKTSFQIIEEVELDSRMTYINTKGLKFNNSVREVLFHVINHSTYHRAQIASDFKSTGINPEITDYIAYKR